MRVLIVRLGSMGDVIHALPAVAALRATHPDAHIGWAIERRWTPLLVADGFPLSGCPAGPARNGLGSWQSKIENQKSKTEGVCARPPQRPLVDSVHVVNTLAWRKALFSNQTWSDVRNAFREIRTEKYDIAIDFQGAIKSAVVGRFSDAPTRIGFAHPREKQATMFYTSTVQNDAHHVIDQNLSLVSSLFHEPPKSEIGNRKSEMTLRSFAPFAVDLLPSDPAAESNVQRRIAGITRFAILNPGAGWGAKQWPAARYGEVARALREDGIASLINYSPAEESLAREVEANSDGAAQVISCSLSELIALTRRASLLMGGDTGPMHLAEAMGVPVVALFGPTDPARTGPYSSQSKIKNQKSEMVSQSTIGSRQSSIVLRHPSSVTDRRHRPEPDPGLLQISAAEVIAAARQLLASHPDTRHLQLDSRQSGEPRS